MSKLDEPLNIRMRQDSIKLFKEKCAKEGRPYTWVFRELVDAYNEGRVRITPKKEKVK